MHTANIFFSTGAVRLASSKCKCSIRLAKLRAPLRHWSNVLTLLVALPIKSRSGLCQRASRTEAVLRWMSHSLAPYLLLRSTPARCHTLVKRLETKQWLDHSPACLADWLECSALLKASSRHPQTQERADQRCTPERQPAIPSHRDIPSLAARRAGRCGASHSSSLSREDARWHERRACHDTAAARAAGRSCRADCVAGAQPLAGEHCPAGSRSARGCLISVNPGMLDLGQPRDA